MTWFAEHCRDEHQPLVNLWDYDGAGLIIRWSSGIWYSNQTDGLSCRQPAAQGIFVPCERVRMKGDKRWPLSEALSACDWPGMWIGAGIRDSEVEQVEAVCTEFDLASVLVVNRERLRDSGESWVFVRVRHDSNLLSGRKLHYPIEAVLTW